MAFAEHLYRFIIEGHRFVIVWLYTEVSREMLYLPFMLLHSNIGCMSIRNAPPVGFPRVANCSDIHPGLADPGENFPLYDRHGILQKWDSCKERSAIWVSNQWCRCEAAKASLHCWIHAKKEAVIAPPWPRFHPVPTKPVFEPEENRETGFSRR